MYRHTLFKGQPQLKEEKIVIQIIRDECRQSIFDDLMRENLGKEPSAQDVEGALDFLIDEVRKSGQLKQILNEYLQGKIAKERAQFGK